MTLLWSQQEGEFEMNAKRIAFGAVAMVLAMGVTNAQDDMKGWYLGVGAGSAAFEVKLDPASASAVDENTTAVRLFGGYRAGKHFAFELGWGDFGEITQADPVVTSPYSASLSGTDVSVFGILPLAKGLVDLYIKTGIAEITMRGTIDDPTLLSPAVQETFKQTNYQLGAGVQINFLEDRSLGLRLDYTYQATKIRLESWDTVSLGILYRF